MTTLGVSVTIIGIISGLLFRKSKIAALFLAAWLWVLQGFNNGGIDFSGNQTIYASAFNWSGISFGNGVIKSLNGFLGGWLSHAFIIRNASYWQYNAFVTFIMIFALYITVILYSKNPGLFFSFLYVYPTIDNIVQKRYFLTIVPIMLGLILLVKNKPIGFAAAIVIAMGFHFSAVVYGLYFLIYLMENKYFKYTYYMMFLFEIYVMFFNRQLIYSIGLVPESKLDEYAGSNVSLLAGMAYSISLLVIIYVAGKILEQIQMNNGVSTGRRYFVQGVIKLNKISVFFVPLMMMDSTFIRYYRPVLLIVYILMGDALEKRTAYQDEKWHIHVNQGLRKTALFFVIMLVFQIAIILNGAMTLQTWLDTLFSYNEVIKNIAGGL